MYCSYLRRNEIESDINKNYQVYCEQTVKFSFLDVQMQKE